MGTDLRELLEARAAEKIREGRRPSKSDLEWLAAIHERESSSSVSLTRNAKGEMQFDVKVYHADPLAAEATAKLIADRLRATYPMNDGTVGSPKKDAK